MTLRPNLKAMPLALEDFDEIIDVRSPSEFAEDHLSGAVNLPVLDDEQRSEVGTVYKQESAFEARKIGAAMTSAQISRHLASHFASKSNDYHPLIYCWRGGQRSGSLATILSEVGFRVDVLEGGYKAYRREVVSAIERMARDLRLVVLNGYTGAGKTKVLELLSLQGAQVIDLEGMAQHKGSVFGGDLEHPQPSQKRFESLIYDSLLAVDLGRPILIEAESAKIGRLNLPNPLWQKMKASPVIEIETPRPIRARYLTEDYQEWLGDIGRIEKTLDRLQPFHSKERLLTWKRMARNREWESLVEELLLHHYDQKYTVGGEGNYEVPSVSVALSGHTENELATVGLDVMAEADKLVERLDR
ncbi:MAG: tRNA 2-selenouridine(34) synthase MnmH [Verrucomicrobiota bacterium]